MRRLFSFVVVGLVWIGPVVLVAAGLAAAGSAAGMEVTVVREDLIDPCLPAFGNGATPSWNFGSPMVVRQGDQVWFSLSRPVEGAKPYANTIWQIYRRSGKDWEVILESPGPADREPCPVVRLNELALAVFINPKVSFNSLRGKEGAQLWNSRPHLLAFPLTREKQGLSELDPVFSGDPVLREHTYRGIAVNPAKGEVIVVVQDPDSELLHPSYLDPAGQWHGLSAFSFPIRGLYPSLYIRDREGHILAVSDVREPCEQWMKAKYDIKRRHWDYVFRHIYYAWSPDVLKADLSVPLVIDSVPDRPGYMRNLDMIVDEKGVVHLLYLKQTFRHAFLRDKFFPNEPMRAMIGYAQVRKGKLVHKRELAAGLMPPDLASAPDKFEPTWGRLHQLEDGSLVAILTTQRDGQKSTWLVSIDGEDVFRDGKQTKKPAASGSLSRWIKVPLKNPIGPTFFTNTPRGGSPADNRIDLLEMTWGKDHHEIRYAEILVRN